MYSSTFARLIASENRKKILLLLEKGPRSAEEIKRLSGLKSASLAPNISRLMKAQYLVKEGEKYKLSHMAGPIVQNLRLLQASLNFFEENFDYWKDLDLSPIPNFLKGRLEELGSFELIETEAEYMFEISRVFLENIRKSREIRSFISLFHPEVPGLYAELVEKGPELSLCLTEPVVKRALKDFQAETKKLMEAENSNIRVCRKSVNLPVFVVTERFMAIKFFENSGGLSSKLMLCYGKGALEWGRDLYRHYEGFSEQLAIRPADFLMEDGA